MGQMEKNPTLAKVPQITYTFKNVFLDIGMLFNVMIFTNLMGFVKILIKVTFFSFIFYALYFVFLKDTPEYIA